MTVDIGFYHCTRAPVVDVAVRLAAKVVEQGERLLMVGADDALGAVDAALWTQIPDSFLAHGRTGGAHDADQPILLSAHVEPANGARMLLLLDHGVPGGIDPFARVLNLFADGSAAQDRARLDWKALAGRDGVTRSYWQQNDRGGWEKRS